MPPAAVLCARAVVMGVLLPVMVVALGGGVIDQTPLRKRVRGGVRVPPGCGGGRVVRRRGLLGGRPGRRGRL